MPYQILINNSVVMTGQVGTLAIAAILVLGAIALLINFLWRKLRENEKLKYEFITIIAHKFRTPLTQIKWLLENLISAETDPYKKESMANMGGANEGLIKMTGSLIEITDSSATSVSEYNFERLNICELAKNISDRLRGNFKRKNIFFSANFPEPEIFVKVDRSRVEFILETILENSVAYCRSGGSVSLVVERVKNKVAVSVTDNGIGIDSHDKGHIFTKFFRTKNAQQEDTEGFGIGLYLAQSVAKRHHGKITVSSEGIDRGSTFNLILPTVR